MILNKLHICFIFLTLGVFATSCSSGIRFAEKTSAPKEKKQSAQSYPKQNEVAIGKLDSPKGRQSASVEDLLVSEAYTWLGTPYRYGGNDRDGVDCSGLVAAVYGAVGISLPRTSRSQYEAVSRIEPDNLKGGDLIFFSTGTVVNHVGIYIGNGEMIHASSSRGVIKQAVADEYYTRRFAGVGRIIK